MMVISYKRYDDTLQPFNGITTLSIPTRPWPSLDKSTGSSDPYRSAVRPSGGPGPRCEPQVSCTWEAPVPGCCSSFTVLPPALFWPRPSCQVRFPPVRRLSCRLKSSGIPRYSTAGRQKLKLDAAVGRRERTLCMSSF